MSRRPIFVAAVKAAYLNKLSAEKDERGAIPAILEVETWAIFGGRSEMLAAPRDLVARTRLVMAGKFEAQKEKAEEASGD